jgi:hypothetical protein
VAEQGDSPVLPQEEPDAVAEQADSPVLPLEEPRSQAEIIVPESESPQEAATTCLGHHQMTDAPAPVAGPSCWPGQGQANGRGVRRSRAEAPEPLLQQDIGEDSTPHPSVARLQGRSRLTIDQKKQLDQLQQDVDRKLEKILTADPTKQCSLEITCPNCESTGQLPWGRMGSLLCCSKCWHWFRVGPDGKLTEVPTPKKFGRASLLFHKDDKPGRSVAVTPADLKKKRKAWARRRFLRLGSLYISDRLVLWLAVVYLIGLTLAIVHYW